MKAPFSLGYLNSILELRRNKLYWLVNHYNTVKPNTRAGSNYRTGCPPHRVIKINGIRYSERRVKYYMRTGNWIKRVTSYLEKESINERR